MFLYRRLNLKKKKKLYFKIFSTKLVSHPCKVSSCRSALSRHSSAAHDSGRNKHDSKIKWKFFFAVRKRKPLPFKQHEVSKLPWNRKNSHEPKGLLKIYVTVDYRPSTRAKWSTGIKIEAAN